MIMNKMTRLHASLLAVPMAASFVVAESAMFWAALNTEALGQNILSSTAPRQPEPRQFPWQAVHYIRDTIAFNNCTIASNTCPPYKLAAASLPYNAIILRVAVAVHVAYNSGTADNFTLGTDSTTATNLMSVTCSLHTLGLTSCTVSSTNNVVLGQTVTQTGANGGFDVWLKYNQTGAAPTAGLASVLIEYLAPNDGLCTPFINPSGTATGC